MRKFQEKMRIFREKMEIMEKRKFRGKRLILKKMLNFSKKVAKVHQKFIKIIIVAYSWFSQNFRIFAKTNFASFWFNLFLRNFAKIRPKMFAFFALIRETFRSPETLPSTKLSVYTGMIRCTLTK